MQISLKSIIREAFNTAYLNKLLNESVESLAAQLSPDQKANADKIVEIMANKGPGWEKYTWTPDGSNGVSPKEWNYVVEKLAELAKTTGDKKYKDALGYAYNFSSKYVNNELQTSALYNTIYKKLSATSALERLLQTDPDALDKYLSMAWARYFAGGKVTPKSGPDAGKTIDMWTRLMQQYNPKDNSNFGAYLVNVLSKEVGDHVKSEIKKQMITKSLDAPSQITGKSQDVGDDDSIDGGEDISNLGDDDIMYGKMSDTSGEFDDDGNAIEAPGEFDISADDNSKNNAKQIRQDEILNKWDNAIETIVNSMKSIPKITDSEKEAFKGVMKDCLTYDEIAAKFPNLFSGTKKINMELNNGNLKEAANEVLAPYGLDYSIFKNSNWDEQYMGIGAIKEVEDTTVKPLNPYDIVEDIIKLFYSKSKLGTTAKNRTAKVFREYALNHKTLDQIADMLGEGGGAQVKEVLINLVKDPEKNKGVINPSSSEEINTNQTKPDLFYKLCVDTLLKNGFPRRVAFNAFIGYDFMAYVKLGKERQAAMQNALKRSGPMKTTTSKQAFESLEIDKKFIEENLETIMEIVYNRLSKNII